TTLNRHSCAPRDGQHSRHSLDYDPSAPVSLFSFNDTAPTEIYTLSLHDALPISVTWASPPGSTSSTKRTPAPVTISCIPPARARSEEHTSELQSRGHLVCRLLLEKKKINRTTADKAETLAHHIT